MHPKIHSKRKIIIIIGKKRINTRELKRRRNSKRKSSILKKTVGTLKIIMKHLLMKESVIS